MSTPRILILSLLLLIPYVCFSQTPIPSSSLANASWKSFYATFRTAVDKRDHTAMLRMMPDNFSDGGGGLTASEWLQFIDDNAKVGSWRDLRRSFALGTIIHKEWSRSKGIPTRVTKDNAYYFEFREDNRWYFAGVVGD